MIENGKLVQNLITLIISVSVTGLMTWLSWITIVIFDHNRAYAKIEILENEVEKLKNK